eukprot:TRINITY_DN1295_c0_g1_i1.p1 TRINITY_DN1295_c0_g1~~TRINITY_DN1295_c0_g1_i1.p1  ORF type:complete len:511 (+),score=123.95 TRINITY_DN1295_c0_g1_i1:109-1533(+)
MSGRNIVREEGEIVPNQSPPTKRKRIEYIASPSRSPLILAETSSFLRQDSPVPLASSVVLSESTDTVTVEAAPVLVERTGEPRTPEPRAADVEQKPARILVGSPVTTRVSNSSGCRNVDGFKKLNRIEEGTYGVVYRAQDRKSGEIVALKKIKMDNEREGFPITSLREITLLITYKHENIVDVKEVVVGKTLDSIFIVMEYIEHDIKVLMEGMKKDQFFLTSEVKCLMLQLLRGINHLHENWILHRDLKTSNLLYSNKGVLKIADFGLAREYGSPLKTYTHMVVTLWYRAPELLLGTKKYTTAIDMWSVGCIFAEFLTKEPLLQGNSELNQLELMFKLLGTPNESIWPGFSDLKSAKKVNFFHQPYNNLKSRLPPTTTEAAFDLLNKMLTYDPKQRITAAEALEHPYFKEHPRAQSTDFMPTFPASNDGTRRRRRKSLDDAEKQKRLILETQTEKERFEANRDRNYGGGFRLRH